MMNARRRPPAHPRQFSTWADTIDRASLLSRATLLLYADVRQRSPTDGQQSSRRGIGLTLARARHTTKDNTASAQCLR